MPELALAAAALAFVVSASAGLGGSLILVPALSLTFGAKQGIAAAALLLAGNNVAKVIAYRRVVPVRAATGVFAMTVAGSFLGALALVRAPERLLAMVVVVVVLAAFVAERVRFTSLPWASAAGLALGAGLTSGFSGTSGPLKGIALRRLDLDRQHLVGAASLVSLGGDLAKSVIFLEARLLDREVWAVILASVVLIPLATLVGRQINRQLGEKAYTGLFWAVMTGYTLRLLLG